MIYAGLLENSWTMVSLNPECSKKTFIVIPVYCASFALLRNDSVLIWTNQISLTDLVALVKAGQTVEHILPQDPSFGIRAYGFRSVDEYKDNIHRIGNLTLLESTLNSSCSNQSVEKKVSNERLYRTSGYQMTKSLAACSADRTPAFSLDNINTRGTDLAKFCVGQWPLW